MLTGFVDYLDRNMYAEGTIKIYHNRILKVANNPLFSNEHIDSIIERFSPGGTHFDSKDHRNTVCALKLYKDYICRMVGKIA
jgi:hypothetical protein